jgi:hypothetical protein
MQGAGGTEAFGDPSQCDAFLNAHQFFELLYGSKRSTENEISSSRDAFGWAWNEERYKQRLRAKIAEIEVGLRSYVVRRPEDDPLRKAIQQRRRNCAPRGRPLV